MMFGVSSMTAQLRRVALRKPGSAMLEADAAVVQWPTQYKVVRLRGYGRGVALDEVGDAHGIGMREMVPTGFFRAFLHLDDVDGAAELAVALGEDERVFGWGHDLIGQRHDVQQRDLGLRDGRERVDRVALVSERLGLGKAVLLEAGLPGAGVPAPLALAAGPTLYVADRCVGIDAGDVLGVPRCVPVHSFG